MQLAILIVAVIIWGVALIGLCSRRDIDVHSKITWLVVILIFHAFGAIVYFIFSQKEEPKRYVDDLSSPSTCMECGAGILSGEDSCKKCGWTYK